MAPASSMSPAWPYTRGAWVLITPPRCKCWRRLRHAKVDKAASYKLSKPVAASATWQGERILEPAELLQETHDCGDWPWVASACVAVRRWHRQGVVAVSRALSGRCAWW